jgi:hypothetical protein
VLVNLSALVVALLVDPILWIVAGLLGHKSKKAGSSVGQWFAYSLIAGVVYSIAVGAFISQGRMLGEAYPGEYMEVGFIRSLVFVFVSYLFYWKTKVPEKS